MKREGGQPGSASSALTRTEATALALTTPVATGVLAPYLTDALGFGALPFPNALVALSSGLLTGAALVPRARRSRADAVIVTTTMAMGLVVIGWLAWPALLPPGSGPDLAHHLLLVDYIEQQGALVHDPHAAATLGEMAQYTPGVHLLAVLAGAATDRPGFETMLPIVALTIALKCGFVSLILLRLLARSPQRWVLAAAGSALIFAVPAYPFGSVGHDSFLAQAAAELFAIVMWWALLLWEERPSAMAMGVFAPAGVATFLTWPIWVGPLVLTLFALVLLRRPLELRTRATHIAIGLLPIVVIAVVHAAGRTSTLALVATSGAVSVPSLFAAGWWLPLLALAGLIFSLRDERRRTLPLLAAAVALQTVVLWLVAGQRGAATPYMALKMAYLAVYPAIAASTFALSAIALGRAGKAIAGSVLVIAVAVGALAVGRVEKRAPVVSRDLFQAGIWARQRFAPSCVDYLVGNEYTAYWLHLAVLRNPRASERSSSNDTYLPQPAIARWLLDSPDPPYAIARLSVLPAEIRLRTRVLQQFGDAAVVSRPGSTPAPAGDRCAVSPRASGS